MEFPDGEIDLIKTDKLIPSEQAVRQQSHGLCVCQLPLLRFLLLQAVPRSSGH